VRYVEPHFGPIGDYVNVGSFRDSANHVESHFGLFGDIVSVGER
jgi:hypothetical protein